MKFSANLGLLWPEIPQIDKIYRAKEAGFDAIEFQFPYDNDATEIKKAIEKVFKVKASLFFQFDEF